MLEHDQVDDMYCEGIAYSVTNVDALAKAVALVLAREFTLAKEMVANSEAPGEQDEIVLDANEVDDIIERRLKPSVVYHRDGFLFQLIMWLAAHCDLKDGDLVAMPHSQASEKGQDSIVVHRTPDAVVALSICEDKATEHPRATVRGDVWREIRDYEKGGRRDELRSNIISTLGLGGIFGQEAESLVRRISWEGKQRYRVRVTVEDSRSKHLFEGFDEVVRGSRERRRGETAHIPSMRAWMTSFATKIETELRRFSRGHDHV